MSLSRKEIHRLVDALPDRDIRTVKQFIEFVLMRSQIRDESRDGQYVTLIEAASVLQLTPKRLRELIREGVIQARKEGRRWLIRSEDLQNLLTAEAREFLSHPFARDDLAADEKESSEEGWREHLAGQTTSLDDLMIKHRHEVPKS